MVNKLLVAAFPNGEEVQAGFRVAALVYTMSILYRFD